MTDGCANCRPEPHEKAIHHGNGGPCGYIGCPCFRFAPLPKAGVTPVVESAGFGARVGSLPMPGSCYACGSIGHVTKSCPYLPRDKS